MLQRQRTITLQSQKNKASLSLLKPTEAGNNGETSKEKVNERNVNQGY